MTGKMRVWLVKSAIRPDIVHWPAVIFSPDLLNFRKRFSSWNVCWHRPGSHWMWQGFCWNFMLLGTVYETGSGLAMFCKKECLRLSDRNPIFKWKVLIGQTRLISLRYYDMWPYSLTISPSDFPLLYEIMGGSLYISLSSGLSWINYHLLIKMFLRFGKAGWYVVTKGRMFFCKADFCSVNLTSEVIFSMRLWG